MTNSSSSFVSPSKNKVYAASSSVLKSPNGSHYACLYERYEGAGLRHPQQGEHHGFTTRRHEMDVAPSAVPILVTEGAKYAVDNISTVQAASTVFVPIPSSHKLGPSDVEGASGDVSAGQSTTFSSRASSVSTRCDWQPDNRAAGKIAKGSGPHDSQYYTANEATTPLPSSSLAVEPHPRKVLWPHSGVGIGSVGLPADLLSAGTSTAKPAPLHKEDQEEQLSPTAIVEPFVSRPVWSLVGTFKTTLQTAVDARKGNALRWTQSNPNGGRQRITIPFVNIGSSEQIRLRMEDLQSHHLPKEGYGRSRSASVDSNASVSSTAARRRGGSQKLAANTIGAKRSRSESAAVARQDKLLARLPLFRTATPLTSSQQQQPTTQPHRTAPRPVTMMAHAVVIKTKDMRPSQVTFGFHSSIEAAMFNSRIRAIRKAGKDYVL